MIFEADPEQIESLDSKDLVRLMKMLLLAESRLAEVPLRSSHVPLQITVPDGGEDGRIEWAGGKESTAFLPRRFCIFQSKAQNLTEALVRAEVLGKKKPVQVTNRRSTKGKRSRLKRKLLSDAISDVIKKCGAYIIFCSSAFTGQKREKLKKAIEASVRGGGGKLSDIAVEVLDANKITEWVNTHPATALWLANQSRRRSLAGFQSHEGWGKSPDVRIAPWVASTKPRFVAVNVAIEESTPTKGVERVWTFGEAADAIVSGLEEDQQCVRLVGPSGFGKTRFAYEVFNRRRTVTDEAAAARVIYADYSIVGDEIPKLAMEIAETGSPSILVVDECPDELHRKLASIAQRADSRLHVLTIDIETRIVHAEKTLTIRLEPASDDMISGIAKGVDPKIDERSLRLIQELATGFPQMAVLGAQQKASGKRTIRSAEQFVDRILWGARQPNPEAQRALSILSLFDWVGLSGRVNGQAAYIAEHLARMAPDAFVEHIKSFKSRGVLLIRGDFVQVQPVPLAVRLAAAQLALFLDEKLFSFFKEAPAELRASLLKRLRWLDTVPEVGKFAAAVLESTELGNREALDTASGSEALDRIVHVAPDLAMATVDRVFGGLSHDELKDVIKGRRHLVWALEKLAFRASTFERAARLLRRLGAAENEERISNNAGGCFKGLYHLYLSGTEAGPEARLRVLDEGLESLNEAERALCLSALDNMLETMHFSRVGGSEGIGSGEPLKDWQPNTYGDIRNFYRSAVTRLMRIALSNDPFAAEAKKSLGRRIRGLMNNFEPKEIKEWMNEIVRRSGFWQEAVQEVNEWLYFDGAKAPKEVREEHRRYFDELLPSDPVELAVMYCQGWHTDFHDPDTSYEEEERKGHTFDYPVRKSLALAEMISQDKDATERTVRALATSEAKSVAPLAARLVDLAADPLTLFKMALKEAELSTKSPNLQFFGGLVTGADRRNPQVARECVRLTLASDKLRPHAIAMIGSGKLLPDDLNLVTSLLQSGDVHPRQCAFLSYGRGLDHLSSKEISPFIDELMKHGPEGLWAALDIIFMYQYPNKSLDEHLRSRIKRILIAPNLFSGVTRAQMDGFHLEQTVAMLAKQGSLTGQYARRLIKRMLKLFAEEEYDVFSNVDGHVRAILEVLIPLFPNEVWSEIVRILGGAQSIARARTERLLDRMGDEKLVGGLLFGLPQGLYLEWVRADAASRASVVARWLPIATKNEDGSLSWDPVIRDFVSEFGMHPSVLRVIGMRMYPSSWWGSIVPFLEPWLPRLREWVEHPIVEVRSWAQKQIDHLSQEIEAERKRDEENSVHFG